MSLFFLAAFLLVMGELFFNHKIILIKKLFIDMTNLKSKKSLLAGRIISILSILFLLFDAVTKIIMIAPVVDASKELSIATSLIQPIGIVLLLCTILYAIPRTSILGAIVLTGYLGGAVAITVRSSLHGHPYFFPIFFGIIIWLGLYLQNEKLRLLFKKP